MSARQNISLFQMTRYHPCGTPYRNKAFSCNACAADLFPVKQIVHVTVAKTYTSMKARDVNKENQMKSSFFRGDISMRKGEVSFYLRSVCLSIKYSSVA